MITLLGSLIGFLGALFPELLRLFRESADRKHEIAILTLQMKQQEAGHIARLEEIGLQTDITERLLLREPQASIGIRWADIYLSTVRPTLTYAFFFLYALIKGLMLINLEPKAILDTPWVIWAPEDQALFAAIISFWFGARQLNKWRMK